MSERSARDAVLSAYSQALIKFKARQLSRKPEFSRSDEDDIVQELTLAILRKAHQYDQNRGGFNTFVDRVVQSEIAMMIRSRRRLKRAAGFVTQPLDQAPWRDDDSTTLRDWVSASGLCGAEAVEWQDFVTAIAKAIQTLPADLQEVCHRLQIDTASVIARDLGISRRQLRKAIELIRQHFENHGLKDF